MVLSDSADLHGVTSIKEYLIRIWIENGNIDAVGMKMLSKTKFPIFSCQAARSGILHGGDVGI